MEKLNLSGNVENSSSAKMEQANNIESPRIFFGTTQDGAEVYDRPDGSHFHEEGGMTRELLAEALSMLNTDGRSFLREQVNFDHIIGGQTCVDVGPEDDIVMVYRKGRNGQTPMVKDREPKPCSSMMVVLRKDFSNQDKNTYDLITSYIGEGSPVEPWDVNIKTAEERQKSEEYWDTHALLYDDNLIDWERTKRYEFMSPADKKAEYIRQRVLFTGIFIDYDDLHQKIQSNLEDTIETPHVTTNFMPKEIEQLHLGQVGSNIKIHAIGYGNDGQNEGLLVKVESEDPIIQVVCNSVETPHITLSIAQDAQAKNTANLDFSPLEQPFELDGKYGLYCQGTVIDSQEDLRF